MTELQRAAEEKALMRGALVRAGWQPRATASHAGRGRRRMVPVDSAPHAAGAANVVRNPNCEVHYNAIDKVSVVTATLEVQRTLEELAPTLDPRAWGRSGGVISKAYPVEDVAGEYKPYDGLDHLKLGTPWPKAGLLFEYATSEAASFENILHCTFTGLRDDKIRIDYYLYDCLRCTFGLVTGPGGLTVNTGYVEVVPAKVQPGKWSALTIVKKVKVRDLTPNDPGNRYDFGEYVNETIGTSLSVWVDDASMMAPFT